MEDKDYIAFEDYRSGTLNADEKTLFEARLKDDAVFKAEFGISPKQFKLQNSNFDTNSESLNTI